MAQPQETAAPRTKTIVINNRESLVIGQMPLIGKDATGAPIVGEAVIFVPGLNLVDTEKLKVLRSNKQFNMNFTTKIPKTPAPEQNQEKVGEFILVAVKEVPEKAPLAKLPDAEAAQMIDETLSVPLLQGFLESEGRSELRALIQNKMTQINTGASL